MKYDSIIEDINIYKSNRHYRLGDVILQRGLRWAHDRDVILNDSVYDNSFVKTYLCHYNCDRNTIDDLALLKAVEEHTRNIDTLDNYLYLSIRTGDVLMTPDGKYDIKNCYGTRYGSILLNSKLLYENIRTIKTATNIKSIQLVTAMHFGDNDKDDVWRYSDEIVRKNRVHLLEILQYISENINLPITHNNNKHLTMIQQIDHDFLTMCVAKHIITEGNHFGELIMKVRNLIKSNI